ncbi:MAG: hypothetical protein JSR58_05600 [Verrucomicrobia bacterium]|nr:hypothetical protein [Verrucomicrobiota bacterium]
MRELLAEAIAKEGDVKELRKRLGKHLTNRSFESDQLNAAYLAAISHILDLPFKPVAPHILPNGLPLEEWAGHRHGSQVPHLYHAIELGILWALLGVLYKREEYTIASVKIAHWLLNLLDNQAQLMLGIWLPGSDYSLRSNLSLLFRIALQITGDARFVAAAPQEIDPHLQTVANFLLPKLQKQERFPLSLFLEEMTVGMMSFRARNWCGVFSLSGHQSGMGAIHHGDVAIAALGPQRAPFDDLSTFGIARRAPFKEMAWEKSATGGLIQGWIQVDEMWVQMAVAIGSEEIHIGVKGEVKPLTSMVFYVHAEAISVDDKLILKKRELAHYRGPTTKLTLMGGKEKIFLTPLGPQTVEILPLCGGNYFFDSDFLIAVSWRDDHLQWKINI